MRSPSSLQTLPNLQQIVEDLRAFLPDIQKRYGVTSLGIFGSYVKGEQALESDVDLLVEFDDRPLTLLQFIALENELSDRLQVPVDLVEKNTLKPVLGQQILNEVMVL